MLPFPDTRKFLRATLITLVPALCGMSKRAIPAGPAIWKHE